MGIFGIPEPHKPHIDSSEFDDPFFGDKKQPKPNVYMDLGDERRKQEALKPIVVTELSPQEQFEILDKLDKRLAINPNIELTQQEAILVYQVDSDLFYDEFLKRFPGGDPVDIASSIKWRRGYNQDMSDTEIRQIPDYEQVKSLIIERLRSEKYVHQTYEALSQIVNGLGLDPAEYTQEIFVQTLIEKMKDWEERGIFDYLTTELITYNNRHNIVPVPNKEFGVTQIFELARKFGEGQPLPTYIYDEAHQLEPLYSQYSSSELSGPVINQDQVIRLRLIPTQYNQGYDYHAYARGRLDQEVALQIQEIQAQYPNYQIQIPSVLETIIYWYISRYLHAKLVESDDSNIGYIKSTDVAQIQLPGKNQDTEDIPDLFISSDGQPILGTAWKAEAGMNGIAISIG